VGRPALAGLPPDLVVPAGIWSEVLLSYQITHHVPDLDPFPNKYNVGYTVGTTLRANASGIYLASAYQDDPTVPIDQYDLTNPEHISDHFASMKYAYPNSHTENIWVGVEPWVQAGAYCIDIYDETGPNADHTLNLLGSVNLFVVDTKGRPNAIAETSTSLHAHFEQGATDVPLNHVLLDGNASARLLATAQVFDAANEAPVELYFDGSLWHARHADLSPFGSDGVIHVKVEGPAADSLVMDSSSLANGCLPLDNPIVNGNPHAGLMLSRVTRTPEKLNTDSALVARYEPTQKRWSICHGDQTPLLPGEEIVARYVGSMQGCEQFAAPIWVAVPPGTSPGTSFKLPVAVSSSLPAACPAWAPGSGNDGGDRILLANGYIVGDFQAGGQIGSSYYELDVASGQWTAFTNITWPVSSYGVFGLRAPEPSFYSGNPRSFLSLFGLWNFGEASGEAVLDQSTRAAHGRLIGGAIRQTQSMLNGDYMHFDGQDGAVQIDNFGPLTGDFTLSFWFRTQAGWNPAGTRLLAFQSGHLDAIQIAMRSKGLISLDDSGGPTSELTITSRTVVDGNWHNVIVTREGTLYTVILDGHWGTKEPWLYRAYGHGDAGVPLTGLVIGARRTWGINRNYFHGDIAYVEIHNRALSGPELEWLVKRVPANVNLPPTDDAWVRRGEAGNGGDGNHLKIQKDRKDGYVKFDLRQIGRPAASAILTCTTSLQDKRGTVHVHGVNYNGWSEETLEGKNAPAIGPRLDSATASGAAGEKISWDVTPFVKDAVSRGAESVSFALVMTEGYQVYFSSKENKGGREAPVLKID
jgi:hypothetical protein